MSATIRKTNTTQNHGRHRPVGCVAGALEDMRAPGSRSLIGGITGCLAGSPAATAPRAPRPRPCSASCACACAAARAWDRVCTPLRGSSGAPLHTRRTACASPPSGAGAACGSAVRHEARPRPRTSETRRKRPALSTRGEGGPSTGATPSRGGASRGAPSAATTVDETAADGAKGKGATTPAASRSRPVSVLRLFVGGDPGDPTSTLCFLCGGEALGVNSCRAAAAPPVLAGDPGGVTAAPRSNFSAGSLGPSAPRPLPARATTSSAAPAAAKCAEPPGRQNATRTTSEATPCGTPRPANTGVLSSSKRQKAPSASRQTAAWRPSSGVRPL